jgi:hypothetical protein
VHEESVGDRDPVNTTSWRCQRSLLVKGVWPTSTTNVVLRHNSLFHTYARERHNSFSILAKLNRRWQSRLPVKASRREQMIIRSAAGRKPSRSSRLPDDLRLKRPASLSPTFWRASMAAVRRYASLSGWMCGYQTGRANSHVCWNQRWTCLGKLASVSQLSVVSQLTLGFMACHIVFPYCSGDKNAGYPSGAQFTFMSSKSAGHL